MSPAKTPQPGQHQRGKAVATCPRRQCMASRQILTRYGRTQLHPIRRAEGQAWYARHLRDLVGHALDRARRWQRHLQRSHGVKAPAPSQACMSFLSSPTASVLVPDLRYVQDKPVGGNYKDRVCCQMTVHLPLLVSDKVVIALDSHSHGLKGQGAPWKM